MRRLASASPDILAPGTLYTFLYCLLASGLLTGQPLIGGALYLLARVIMMLFPLARNPLRGLMSRGLRRLMYAAVVLSLLFSLALLAAIPKIEQTSEVWPLAGIVALSMVRLSLSRNVIAYSAAHGAGRARAVALLFLTALCAAALLVWMTSGSEGVWSLAIGYLLASALEAYCLMREPERESPSEALLETPDETRSALSSANAYRSYERMRGLILCALQVSLVMMYTYLGTTHTNIIVSMAVVLFFTAAASEAARRFAKRAVKRQSDPVYVILSGMLIWGVGMLLFAFRSTEPIFSYLFLALTTCGVTLCSLVADSMRDEMRIVSEFVTGAPPDSRERAIEDVRTAFASVAGQLISLAGLLGLMLLSGRTDIGALFSGGVGVFLLAPALLLVFCAALSALSFPLTRAWLRKLHSWLTLRAEGSRNEPLENQLTDVVIRKHRRHTGMRVLISMIRPLYYHRIQHAERVPKDGGVPIVFLCNHGEMYGPVVTNLYVPFSFRPWVISEMAVPEQVTQYMLDAMINLKLVPRFLQRPLARLCTPVMLWIMRSIECIPVYRSSPRALVRTLRDTVTAMEAGDNILLFPEHAGEGAKDAAYRREGVGEFHNGFVTLGDMYADRTGKGLCYMPMYASKRKRTLTFGNPVYHNPSESVITEKHRVCEAVRAEMLKIYHQEIGEDSTHE